MPSCGDEPVQLQTCSLRYRAARPQDKRVFSAELQLQVDMAVFRLVRLLDVYVREVSARDPSPVYPAGFVLSIESPYPVGYGVGVPCLEPLFLLFGIILHRERAFEIELALAELHISQFVAVRIVDFPAVGRRGGDVEVYRGIAFALLFRKRQLLHVAVLRAAVALLVVGRKLHLDICAVSLAVAERDPHGASVPQVADAVVIVLVGQVEMPCAEKLAGLHPVAVEHHHQPPVVEQLAVMIHAVDVRRLVSLPLPRGIHEAERHGEVAPALYELEIRFIVYHLFHMCQSFSVCSPISPLRLRRRPRSRLSPARAIRACRGRCLCGRPRTRPTQGRTPRRGRRPRLWRRRAAGRTTSSYRASPPLSGSLCIPSVSSLYCL